MRAAGKRHSTCRFVGFFFNDTATTEIYTLSLHDALPISGLEQRIDERGDGAALREDEQQRSEEHTSEFQSRFGISYAVFCLKKKTKSHRRRTGNRAPHSRNLQLTHPST